MLCAVAGVCTAVCGGYECCVQLRVCIQRFVVVMSAVCSCGCVAYYVRMYVLYIIFVM